MNKKPFFVEFMGTPESGKTTTVKKIEERLTADGHNVSIVRESAEILPKEFEKGSYDAAVWMYLNTVQAVKIAIKSDIDVVVADRGILDGMFYNMRFSILDPNLKTVASTLDEFVKSLEIMPNLLINLVTTSEECINRRGGEGRLVTKQYIESYNQHLDTFHKTIEVPKIKIDTTKKQPDEVVEIVYGQIVNRF